MAEGETQKSGELSSFLHLTGWRPVLLALVAGLAGAAGMYFALQNPAEWVGRFVVNGQRVADDDFSPAELDLFVEEISLATRLPQVRSTVEEVTGLVEEEDYEITANQAPASVGLINISVVTDSAEAVRLVAIETAIAALDLTLTSQKSGLEAGRDQLRTALTEADERIGEIAAAAGGVDAVVAYDRAAALLLDRQDFLNNRPTVTVADANGNLVERPAPDPVGPSLEELQAEVDRLEPLSREFKQVTAEVNQLSLQLSGRNNSIREIDGAIASLATERDSPFIVSEVEVEEASRISGLLTGVLLFAVPAALLMIIVFVLYDLIRPKPEPLQPAQPLDSFGILEAGSARALPEASITTLVVVDDEVAERSVSEDSDTEDEDSDAIYDVEDEDTDAQPPRKSKSSRWGRDADSKAG